MSEKIFPKLNKGIIIKESKYLNKHFLVHQHPFYRKIYKKLFLIIFFDAV